MRLEWMLLAGAGVFYAIVAVFYWWWAEEPVGTVALAMTTGLAALVGFYLWFTSKHIDPRPEDALDAEVEDGAGPYGFFSPHSWWPLPCAASAATIALGLVFGWWLVAFGLLTLSLSVIGLVFEYYRPGREIRH